METQISPIAAIAGAFIPLIVQFVKNSPFFTSFNETTNTRLTALSFFLSATAALVGAFSDGTLDHDTLTNFANAIGTVIATFGVSEMVYQKFVKPINSPVDDLV